LSYFYSLLFSIRIDESETAKNERLKKWETFLEAGEDAKKEKVVDSEAMETKTTSEALKDDDNEEKRPAEPQSQSRDEEEEVATA
jgi:hypothetical protein